MAKNKETEQPTGERVAVQLLQDWRGSKAGAILPLVPRGQAKLMVQQGTAKFAKQNEAVSKKQQSSKRTPKTKRSEKTS